MLSFTLAECDGWQALYVNGEKVIEGHSISPSQMIDITAKYMRSSRLYLKSDWVEENGCPDLLSDIPMEAVNGNA